MYISMKQCSEAIGQQINGVIHIGAHLGEEAEDYKQNGVKNVLWVEANKNLMKDLYDRTNFLGMRSKYLNEVLSDKDGENVTLNIANNGQSSSILELGTHSTHYPHIQYVKKVPAKTKRFDTIYKENITNLDLDKYDFINLDVQGAELKVLKGFGDLFQTFDFKAIYTEVNFEEVYKNCCLVEDLDKYLSKYGFMRVMTAAPEGCFGDALYLRK